MRTNEEFERDFQKLTPENKKAFLAYIEQLLKEQEKEEQE